MQSLKIGAVVLACWAAVMSPALAQEAPAAVGVPGGFHAVPAPGAVGAGLRAPAGSGQPGPGMDVWNARCSQCHDNPNERIPPHQILSSSRSPEAVAYALTKGLMKAMGVGLTPDQVKAVTVYLTGKEPGASAEVDAAANMCKHTAPKMTLGTDDWNGWGVDSDNTRLQPHSGLTAANVPKLKLKWAFAYQASTDGQPTVAGGRLFVADRSALVWSLDPKTGCTYWVIDLGVLTRTAIMIGKLPPGSPAKYAAYFTTEDSFMKAVDAETGKELWSTRVEDHPLGHITGSGILYDGRIYQGTASQEEVANRDLKYPCCTFRGGVVAVDAVTGKILWKNTTIAAEPKQIDVSPTGTPLFGPAGAGVWATPVIDAKRNAVYVATGNSYTQMSTPESNAVVAFDMDTGKRLWVTQTLHNDNFCPSGMAGCVRGPDQDLTGGVILRDLPNGKRVVLAGAKTGEAFGFDPDDNGKLLWRRQVHTASGYGGSFGYGADSKYFYVNSPNLVPGPGQTPGGIAALDPATGEVAWYAKPSPPKCSWSTEESLSKLPLDCTGAQQAGVALIPGVLFGGSIDGHIRAYDVKDGSIMWDFDTGPTWDGVNGAKAHGGSISHGSQAIGEGMLFVNSGTGGHHDGNALLAFSVDGK